MNILVVCVLGLMVLALGIACSVLWYAFDISKLAKKNLNRVESGHRWTSQDMVENHCRLDAADLALRISVVFWVLLVVAGWLILFSLLSDNIVENNFMLYF